MFACIADESVEKDYTRVTEELKLGRAARQKVFVLSQQVQRQRHDQQADRRWYEAELQRLENAQQNKLYEMNATAIVNTAKEVQDLEKKVSGMVEELAQARKYISELEDMQASHAEQLAEQSREHELERKQLILNRENSDSQQRQIFLRRALRAEEEVIRLKRELQSTRDSTEDRSSHGSKHPEADVGPGTLPGFTFSTNEVPETQNSRVATAGYGDGGDGSGAGGGAKCPSPPYNPNATGRRKPVNRRRTQSLSLASTPSSTVSISPADTSSACFTPVDSPGTYSPRAPDGRSTLLGDHWPAVPSWTLASASVAVPTPATAARIAETESISSNSSSYVIA